MQTGGGEPGDGSQVNHCPSCGGEIDITGLGPFTKVACPSCGEAVRVRTQLGNFHIKSLLGEGGMSQVFLAEDLALNRQVALKILHQELTRDASLMALFEREAKLTASINHPNVVKVYTVGSDGGYFFIAMELLDNVSLEARIAELGMVPEREGLDLLHDVAAGLKTAFQGGLIHRDIKPGNILLTRAGTAKLVDFGLALQQGGEDHVEDLWATPFYVPPEKLEGKPDDFRGDIYSLGATFFHALSGRPPFQANTASLDELRAIKANPVSLAQASAPVSAATIKLIDKMMAYKPEARFKTYDELLGAIEETQARLPGSAASRARRENALAPGRQGLGGLAWAGIVGVALSAIGLIVVLVGGNPNGTADLPDPLAVAAGDRVLAAGQDSLAARYTGARDLLLAGRIPEARRAFEELLREEDLKQPTRGWAEYNAGLVALLEGAATALTVAPPAAPSEAPEEPVAAFVRKVAAVLSQPGPVPADEAGRLVAGSFEGMGLLAYGLKNWNHGEFDSAMAFFDAFGAIVPPEDATWMAAYRVLVEPYRADHALLKTLPAPQPTQTEAELAGVKEALQAAAGRVRTRGRAREWVLGRVSRVDEILEAKREMAAAPPVPAPASVQPPAPPVPSPLSPAMSPGASPGLPSSEGWTPEAEAERGRLAEAIGTVREAMGAYRFAEAASVVSGFAAATEPVKRVQQDYLEALKQAESFRGRLVVHLNSGEYSGKLHRKAGLALDVKVVAADQEKLVVDLMFGPNDLAWKDVSAAWMLGVAREAWLKGLPEESSAGDWIEAAWFARQAGLTAEAAQLAETLAPLSEEFASRWERLRPLP